MKNNSKIKKNNFNLSVKIIKSKQIFFKMKLTLKKVCYKIKSSNLKINIHKYKMSMNNKSKSTKYQTNLNKNKLKK